MAENENTEYLEDGVSVNFTKYVFGREPQEKNSIKLELQSPEKDVNFNQHVFQQLLQIFTDGFKYLYGKNGQVDPNNLTEDQILPEAKVIAVSDVVEAMSSHRPYRPALGIDVALEEISNQRNKKLDSDAVDACVDLFNRGFEFSVKNSLVA